MAGVKGQPSPKPQSLPNPVPQEDALQAFQSTANEIFKPDAQALQAFEAAAQGGEAPAPASSGQVSPFNPISDEMLAKGAEYLPAAGGILGGILGAAGGPAGAVGGAALGGAAGQSYRDLIEQQILGKRMKEPMEQVQDIATAGGIEGAGQAIGAGVVKLGGKIASGVARELYTPAKEFISQSVKRFKDAAEEPLTKLIANKASTMSALESGDAAKKLLSQNIKTKYGSFIQAYEGLDNVNKALPLADEARRGFTQKLKGWALDELGGDNYKIVKKFADDFDASLNGKQFDDVLKQIGDAKNVAFRNGATEQARVLGVLQERANDFVESRISGLAQRVASGKAGADEMLAFERMMASQQNPNVPVDPSNLTKYTKSVAKDFLNNRDRIRSDYSGFKSFLEDVGEQTKVGTRKKGPLAFLGAIEDVPSEKLIERMFDPKNAAALRRMQQETPEVFDVVSRAKVNQMLAQSSPTGSLDLKAFQKAVNTMPEDTRRILFSPDDVKMINKVALDPKLKWLQQKEAQADGFWRKWVNDITNIAAITGQEIERSPLRPVVQAPLQRSIGMSIGEKMLPPGTPKE